MLQEYETYVEYKNHKLDISSIYIKNSLKMYEKYTVV